MEYRLVNKNNIVGHRGKSYDADNINRLPQWLLERLAGQGLVVTIKNENDGTERAKNTVKTAGEQKTTNPAKPKPKSKAPKGI